MARPRLAEDSPTEIDLITRDDFLKRYWPGLYQPGEHVSIIGKTGSGKTYLAFQLLGATISQDMPGIVLVMKPRDSTVVSWSKKLGLKRVYTWPPNIKERRYDNPPGWVLWPKLGNYDTDDDTLRTQFDRCFRESYSQASGRNAEPRVLFADEIVGISKDLKPERRGDPDLDKGLKAIWSRGRSLEIGMWAATQRPFEAPQLMYQSPEHLFFAAEPDERSRIRLGEIGGFDSALLRTIVDPSEGVLGKHQFLYLHRGGKDGGTMAVIDS